MVVDQLDLLHLVDGAVAVWTEVEGEDVDCLQEHIIEVQVMKTMQQIMDVGMDHLQAMEEADDLLSEHRYLTEILIN